MLWVSVQKNDLGEVAVEIRKVLLVRCERFEKVHFHHNTAPSQADRLSISSRHGRACK